MAKTVLVAEDHLDARVIIVTILEYAGYEVIQAADGVEAIEKAETHKPDLLLLDISMPRMSGWEVCERLRAEPSTAKIPIIIITAHALSEDQGRGLAAGADGYVTKPVEPRAVLDYVTQVIGKP